MYVLWITFSFSWFFLPSQIIPQGWKRKVTKWATEDSFLKSSGSMFANVRSQLMYKCLGVITHGCDVAHPVFCCHSKSMTSEVVDEASMQMVDCITEKGWGGECLMEGVICHLRWASACIHWWGKKSSEQSRILHFEQSLVRDFFQGCFGNILEIISSVLC